ncbi:unnamed protein product [Ilex paraguariensis]|uniref:Sigma non-opioid intracellular receptor 1 n=1 Tax=Ilex paraguariensis TaxID=185542 RepID=A0ABC8SB10_9AQUA
MKTVVLTSESSVKSFASTNMESESRDSCYFPGCRKDANCGCEICIASINATLDLMPQSIQRSSLTKLSVSKPIPRSPVSFNPSFLSTPRSSTPTVLVSPPLNSTARMGFHEKIKRKKRELGIGFMLMRLFRTLSLVFLAEFGFSWVVSGVFQPKLSPDIIRHVGQKSWVLPDLNERLSFLKKEIENLVQEEASNCSTDNSVWDINQDGLLLNSHCTLYKSAIEEVSIWGWPLQTAGLLTAEFSSRSFTILSGRVTEWFNGEVGYQIRHTNSSWVQGKWSSSVVQLDRSTWILEYRRSSLMENGRLISAAIEFLKFRMMREVQKMKQEFWLLYALGRQYRDFTGESFRVPT